MQNKNSDRFEITQKSSRSIGSPAKFENFFMNEKAISNSINNSDTNISKRLNDYDLNLLQEDAYKDVEDNIFKLEYKIQKIEEELNYINSQLQVAIEVNDFISMKELASRKMFLENHYKELLSQYNSQSLSARITESLSNIFTNKFKMKLNFINKFWDRFFEKLAKNLPQECYSIFELKKSLNKLENINKSVDELITMNNKYGNNTNRYEQLSKYIIKANSIQTQINNSIKKNKRSL